MALVALIEEPLALDAQTQTYVSPWFDLPPDADMLTARVQRETTGDDTVDWNNSSHLQMRFVIEVDGGEGVRWEDGVEGSTRYVTGGRTKGGIQYTTPSQAKFVQDAIDAAPEGDHDRILADHAAHEATHYTLGVHIETGFYDQPERDEDWAEWPMKRLGQTTVHGYRARVEVERLAGRIASVIGLYIDDEPAPPPKGWHSSIAFLNSAVVEEGLGGDGQLSMSFTASAGSDRVAYVFGATSRDTRPTAASVTYDGGINTDLGDVTNSFWRGAGGLAFDSRIGAGAKTVAFASSGGGGTQYQTSLAVIAVSGAHQTTHGTPASSGADSGTALSITVPGTPASDSLILDMWAWVTDITTSTQPTWGADQTQRVTTFTGAAVVPWTVGSSQPGSAGAVMSVTKQTTNFEYVGMAVEIKAAGAAPKGPPPFQRKRPLWRGRRYF